MAGVSARKPSASALRRLPVMKNRASGMSRAAASSVGIGSSAAKEQGASTVGPAASPAGAPARSSVGGGSSSTRSFPGSTPSAIATGRNSSLCASTTSLRFIAQTAPGNRDQFGRKALLWPSTTMR